MLFGVLKLFTFIQIRSELSAMSFEKVFATLNKRIEMLDVVELTRKFKSFATDLERVEFVLNLDASKSISFSEGLFRSNKDAQKSEELRAAGNEFFKNGDMILALSKYTESLCYATQTDAANCLPLAFANRSAALYRLNKYAEAAADIDLAIKNNYPLNLRPKILDRKGDCLKAMNNLSLAEDCYREAFELCKSQNQRKLGETLSSKLKLFDHTKTDSEQTLTQSEIIPTFQRGSNPSYPNLSSSCEVAYDRTKGRHIQALRDIKPGEIILIEKPFASILAPERFLTHCHYCLTCVENPLPCTSCVHSVFCSDKCMINAKKSFHRYECLIMEALEMSGLDKFSRLVTRTILCISASEIKHYVVQKDFAKPEGKYNGNDYGAICNLLTNDSKRSVNDLFRRSVIAIYILRIIEKTSYFQGSECFDVKLHVAALLLNHLQSFPCNAHEISEFVLNRSSVVDSVPRELGAGIYATLSLFNHSCNPVVTRNFYKDICIVRAISVISKGSEITDNYGVVFQLHSREERNKYLNPQYFFDCCCSACKEDWPTFADSLKKLPQWKCSECTYPLKAQQNDTLIHCYNCGKSQNLLAKKTFITEAERIFKKAYDLMLLLKPSEASSGICTYLESLNQVVCEPWNEFARGQESLKQCYSMMANRCLNTF